MSLIRRRLFVSGRVQGVGFRAAMVREAARHPDIRGLVRNLPDGRVEALFQGEAARVLTMVDWCRHGPPQAQVARIEVREEEVDPALPPFGRGDG